MLLGALIVLFLGSGFFLSDPPQGVCASPAIMPTTACVALASQEKSRASALLHTLRLRQAFSQHEKLHHLRSA